MRISALVFTEVMDIAPWIILTVIVVILIAFFILQTPTYNITDINDIAEGLQKYVFDTLQDINDGIAEAYGKLPLAWYTTLVLTFLPMLWHMPKHWMVYFLLAYCVSSGFVCAIKTKKNPKQEIVKSEMKCHFLSGMRITI